MRTSQIVAMLYLLNQDTKSLSLEELYVLYRDTVSKVEECAKKQRKDSDKKIFSFD